MDNAKKYVEFFNNLNKEIALRDYMSFFDDNSYFEDPFQKVRGVEKIYNIFEDMYIKFHSARFEVEECVSNQNISYIKWKFIYQMDKKSTQNSFVGVSRVKFKDDGKVLEHIDFWDAGANVYEKIPFLASIIRFIKRKIHA